MLNQLWAWYQTSGFSHATIFIPGIEAMVLLALLTICLLFHVNRIGLITAYIFTYRWGLLFGMQYFAKDAKIYHVFLTSYIVFGILVLTLALAAMMLTTRSGSNDKN